MWIATETNIFFENTLFSDDGHHLIYNPTDEPAFINQETIGQYTGMKDCDGTEIYEGDIVSTDDEDIAVITWDEDEYKFTVYTEEYFYDLGEYYPKDLEVIGNIHKNPELLGGDAK